MSVGVDARTDEPVPGLLPNGLPDLTYARALGLVPAGFGRRSLAFVIDAAILLILAVPTMLAILPLVANFDPSDPSVALSGASVGLSLILLLVGQGLTTIYQVVQLLLHGRKGITVGKAMLGIRSVNVTTFARPGFWRIVLRVLVFSFAFLIFPPLLIGVFLASSLWDGEKRGRSWLDKVGKNWMIDVRSGLDPFDAKALRLARKRVAAPVAAEVRRLPSLATGSSVTEGAFVPSVRSSSGVISAPSGGQSHWQPPSVGAEQLTPATQSVDSPGLDGSPPARSAAPAPRFAAVLVFDDDSRVSIEGPGLIGRDPAPAVGETAHRLLPIADDSWQLSKTHAEFGVDSRGVWISDRASSNGTLVRSPSGEPHQLGEHERAYLVAGSIVEIGGRSFTVLSGEISAKAPE